MVVLPLLLANYRQAPLKEVLDMDICRTHSFPGRRILPSSQSVTC